MFSPAESHSEESSADTTSEPDGGTVLRRFRPEDASSVLEAFQSDPEMSRQGTVTDLAQAENYIRRLTPADQSTEAWVVAVNGKLVGLVCINVDQENRNGWFSYWMTSASRGLGLTSRAAATAADWALFSRGLERLELGHRVNNPASGAVARAAGFVHEGTERAKFLVGSERIDVLTYGRLRTDPAPAYEPLPMIGS